MRRSRWVAVVAAMLLVVSGEAQDASDRNGTISRLLDHIQVALGAPPPQPAPETPEETLASVREILDKPSTSASDVLAQLRTRLSVAAKGPASDDGQTLELIRAMVRSLQVTPPQIAAAMIRLPRKSGHPDPNVLEHSHIYFALHDMLFEAQLAPNIFVFDNRERTKPHGSVDEGIYSTDVGQHRWAVSWSFTPMIRLRNLKDTSGPIKTLSWMPKTDIQVIRLNRGSHDANMFTLHGTVGHHSNGQDECTYQPGILDRQDLCRTPARVQDVTLNYPNGSFSTNYLRAGLVWKHLKLTEDLTAVNALVTSTRSVGFYGETNPHWLKIGGTLPPALAALYGKTRLRVVGEIEWRVGGDVGFGRIFKGSVRLTGWLDYIDKLPAGVPATSTSRPDAPLNAFYQANDGSSRWRFGFELAWNPDWARGWGLEARYDHGQDYYNILFARDIRWFQAGIVFDAAEFLPFATKRPKK